MAFLRALVRGVPADTIALKGGSNLRFFFGSVRYSEDMDVDAQKIAVHVLRGKVMKILESKTLQDSLRTYGIVRIVPPDLRVAKQTETVQRFKVHLITSAGEDLSTKIEFSRRGIHGSVRIEAVSLTILSAYQMPPLIIPHYAADAAIGQKLQALAQRSEPQARDVFDLYVLSAHPDAQRSDLRKLGSRVLKRARDTILSIEYRQYRDTVASFLEPDDQTIYDSPSRWVDIQLAVTSLIDRALSS